ncbi:MAG: hypothetical protein ACRDMV_17890 [Streptosporangiales bacterium]
MTVHPVALSRSGTPPARASLFPLRPLGIGEVLDAAVTVMRAYPKISIGVSALMYGCVTALVAAAAGTVVVGAFVSDSALVQTVALTLGGIGITAASLLRNAVQMLGAAVLSSFMAGIVGRAALGRPATVRTEWRETKRSLGWLVLFWVIVSFAVLPPAILVLVLGAATLDALPTAGPYVFVALLVLLAGAALFFLAQLWLAPAAIVLERVHVLRGFKRSWQLNAGARWRATWICALTGLMCLLVYFAISAGLFSMLNLVATAFGSIASTAVLVISILVALYLGALLVGTVCTPFVSVVPAVAYLDMRMRAEGLDLTLRELRTDTREIPPWAVLVGPGSPFAAPGDPRPPEPPPGVRPVPVPPPVAPPHAVGG